MNSDEPEDTSARRLLDLLQAPRTLIVALVLVILTTTFLAIRFTDITGSSDNEDVDLPEVLAQTGCLDMDIIPLTDPPVSLPQAEADVRAQLDEVDSITGIGEDDDFEPGDLLWAEYGELQPGSSGRPQSGEAWILVFEDDRHESWWDRLANRRVDARFSVVYRPESGTISAACGGRV